MTDTRAEAGARVPRFTNRLIGESSPYLLSHAHNPVNWYPWGEEAFRLAKELDRPIFLSIGYAACHWCHVMERESFENEEIAEILNDAFVAIKLDREQRPDIDHIYMTFTQAMAGHGGWPMSVFLTPNLKPFFAGTYYPPDDLGGHPGFKRILAEIVSAYRETRDQVVASADAIYQEISKHVEIAPATTALKLELITAAGGALLRNVDHTYGGFGQAPKFPHPLELSLFLRLGRKTGDLSFLLAAEKALCGMARGGIYDHVGGGFARYSTDERWLVPHFEKMLYDNALLAPVYADAYRVTGNELYRKVVRETLDFILREMTESSGGFYSSLDADSEGDEGKFYVWDKVEIEAQLKPDAELFCRYYNVSEAGNFEGRNILNIDLQSDRVRQSSGLSDTQFDSVMKRCLPVLLATRSERVRPATDDKVLTSWNGLTVAALCCGYQITGDQKYLNAATANAHFVRSELWSESRLTHSWRDGTHSQGEFLEDYAYYIHGLVALFQTHGSQDNNCWLEFAAALAENALKLFFTSDGRFYLRPDGHSDLIFRPHEETDSALPSAGSMMILNLLKLERLTGRSDFAEAAQKGLQHLSGILSRHGAGMTSALLALEYYLSPKVEIVVTGDSPVRAEMMELLNRQYLPNTLVAASAAPDDAAAMPLFQGRYAPDGSARAYVCQDSTCRLPAATTEELLTHLRDL